VKTYRTNTPARSAEILVGGLVVARVVYRPERPLSCGARVWLETDAEVHAT
jgi:hypothetical protein